MQLAGEKNKEKGTKNNENSSEKDTKRSCFFDYIKRSFESVYGIHVLSDHAQ
jgi:hypothetical protein